MRTAIGGQQTLKPRLGAVEQKLRGTHVVSSVLSTWAARTEYFDTDDRLARSPNRLGCCGVQTTCDQPTTEDGGMHDGVG
jgi:hypothetical protein